MLTLLYGVLAVVEVRLLLTYIAPGRRPAARAHRPDADDAGDADRPLAFAY